MKIPKFMGYNEGSSQREFIAFNAHINKEGGVTSVRWQGRKYQPSFLQQKTTIRQLPTNEKSPQEGSRIQFKIYSNTVEEKNARITTKKGSLGRLT